MSTLPQRQREYIERAIASGRYADETEALTVALDLLEERDTRQAEARRQFRDLLRPGLDAIEHGREVSPEEAFARARAVLDPGPDASA